MAVRSQDGSSGGRTPWRIIGWTIPLILLLLPLVAMQFTPEVNWTHSDFIFAAVLFGSVGAAFELIVRTSSNRAFRAGAAVAIIAAFLTVWINAAVGMIGDDNSYNMLFLGVLLVALTGAVVARLEARAMGRAMIVAGLAQAAVAAGGLSIDPRGGILSMLFAGLWLLSAALFWSAARETPDGIRT